MQLKASALLLFISLCRCSELNSVTKGTSNKETVVDHKGELASTEKPHISESFVLPKSPKKGAVSSVDPITIVVPTTDSAPTAPSSPSTPPTSHTSPSSPHTPKTPTTPATPETPTTPVTPKPPTTPATPKTPTAPSPTPNPTAPSTPHTSPATTTVAPTSAPIVDEVGDWKVNYTTSSICTRLVGSIKLTFGLKKPNATEEVEVIAVPKNAVASGNCTVGSLNLTWPSNLSANSTKKNDTVIFTFKADEKAQTWKLDSIQGEVITKTKEKIHFHTNATSVVTTHKGTSYFCSKVNSFSLNFSPKNLTGSNVTSATLNVAQLQVEAFKAQKPNNLAFSPATNCELTPDIVPIVVGCALAALVVAVLIAYVIAQRRPFAQGYRSV
nr:PREDICTED: integumentary mucin A.1-like [Bemisia tabaci]